MSRLQAFKQGASYVAIGIVLLVIASRPAWGLIKGSDSALDLIPIVLVTLFGCVRTQYGCM